MPLVPNGTPVPYPPRTANLHHEIELVVAIGTGGRDIPLANALAHVFGYAVGNDLTRRDLQFAAREQGRPWDVVEGLRLLGAGERDPAGRGDGTPRSAARSGSR